MTITVALGPALNLHGSIPATCRADSLPRAVQPLRGAAVAVPQALGNGHTGRGLEMEVVAKVKPADAVARTRSDVAGVDVGQAVLGWPWAEWCSSQPGISFRGSLMLPLCHGSATPRGTHDHHRRPPGQAASSPSPASSKWIAVYTWLGHDSHRGWWWHNQIGRSLVLLAALAAVTPAVFIAALFFDVSPLVLSWVEIGVMFATFPAMIRRSFIWIQASRKPPR